MDSNTQAGKAGVDEIAPVELVKDTKGLGKSRADEPGLIGDIGGTNVRFALYENGRVRGEKTYKCADYDGLAPAARAYLHECGIKMKPQRAALAIAGPVFGDRFQMTNHPWAFSIEDVRRKLGLKELRLVNDFHALAMAIPHLENSHITQIGHGESGPGQPKAVIGPGTGLGVSCLFWDGLYYRPVPGEGGHVTMPARTQREFAVFEWLRQEKYSHVSAERVCSGKGLVNIYSALCHLDGKQAHTCLSLSPEEITDAVRDGANELALEAWHMMTGFLGVVAGNLALTLGAHGGVYLAGGILPQTKDLICHSNFRDSFVKKGRFENYLDAIPTYLVHHPFPAFLGLQAYLSGEQPA